MEVYVIEYNCTEDSNWRNNESTTVDLKVQYETIKDQVIKAISNVCDSQAFALGPAVGEFEEKNSTILRQQICIRRIERH